MLKRFERWSLRSHLGSGDNSDKMWQSFFQDTELWSYNWRQSIRNKLIRMSLWHVFLFVFVVVALFAVAVPAVVMVVHIVRTQRSWVWIFSFSRDWSFMLESVLLWTPGALWWRRFIGAFQGARWWAIGYSINCAGRKAGLEWWPLWKSLRHADTQWNQYWRSWGETRYFFSSTAQQKIAAGSSRGAQWWPWGWNCQNFSAEMWISHAFFSHRFTCEFFLPWKRKGRRWLGHMVLLGFHPSFFPFVSHNFCVLYGLLDDLVCSPYISFDFQNVCDRWIGQMILPRLLNSLSNWFARMVLTPCKSPTHVC